MGGLYIPKASADLITLGQIPGAFKGYPSRMKQAITATASILLVSLLTGCSTSDAKVCEEAETFRAFYFAKAESNFMSFKQEVADELARTGKGSNPAIEKYIAGNLENKQKGFQVIVNNPKCYSAGQVVEAQDYIEKNK